MSTTATSAAQEATTTVATPDTAITTETTETVVTNDGTETITTTTTTTTTTEKTATAITEEQITESKEAEVKETKEVKETEEVKETKEVKEAEEEEVKEISKGYLYKQRNTIIFNWGNKYFVFGVEKHSLPHLQIYHDKTLKPAKPGTTTAESTEAPAVDEAELKESHKSLFSNIAHATVTGEGLLFYYKSDKNLSKPQGIINLAEVQEVKENKSLGKLHVFTIKTTTREYHLQASNEKELNQWTKAILDKVENAKRVSAEVQTKDGYKECYEKLVQKKAFVSGKLPESELMSSDEDDSPREPKRRATLTTYLFSSFKKPEATTSEAKTETEEKTEEVLETKKVTIATTSDVVDGAATSTEKVESPKRGGSFSFFSRSKSPTAKPKEETKEDGDTKGETSKADGKEKAEEVIAVVETSTTVEATEKKEEEKKETGNFLTKFLSGAKKTAKEEITTETEQTITEETTIETNVVAKTDAVVEKDNTPEVSEDKEEKKESGNFLTKLLSGAKKTAKEETTTETEQTITEETTIIESDVAAKTDAVVEKDNTPEVSEDKEEKKEGGNFLTKLLSGPKKTTKEETTTETEQTITEEITIETDVAAKTDAVVEKDNTPEVSEDKKKKKIGWFKRGDHKTEGEPKKEEVTEETTEVTETKIEEVTETIENNVSDEAKPDSTVDIKRSQSVFKRISGKFMPTKRHPQDGSSDVTHGKEPSEVVVSGSDIVVENTNATEAGGETQSNVETQLEKEMKQKKAAAAHSGTLLKESKFMKQFHSGEFFFEKEESTITYYSKTGPGKTIKITHDVKINKSENTKQFEIVTSSRTYRLEANTPEECDQWVKVLSDFKDTITPVVDTKEEVETNETNETEKKATETTEVAKMYDIAANSVTATTTEAVESSDIKEIISEKVEEIVTPKVEEIEAIKGSEEVKEKVEVEEKVEVKAEEAKVEEAKVEEAKVEEAKVEEAKVEEVKVEEVKVEEAEVKESEKVEVKESEKVEVKETETVKETAKTPEKEASS